ncbi:MAG: DUF1631 family protein [Sinobacterium sp.]|nr:DUF1631 family protein [Sinobacterium sp.]
MTINLELLLKADELSFERILDVHFAQGKLLSDEFKTDKPSDLQLLSTQRELASSWLFQQKFQLATWDKPAFQRLINGLNQHLHKNGSVISNRLLSELRLSFLLLNSLEKTHDLSPSVAQRLFSLRPILLAYSVQQSNFWFSGHAIKKLFDQLYRSSLGLQDGLGRQSDASISLLQQFIDKTMVHTLSSTADLFDLMKAYKVETATANTRLQRLLDRLLESEKGVMQSGFANKHSAQTLLNMTQNLSLPDYWVQFLLKSLRAELNVLIVEQGVKSKKLQEVSNTIGEFLTIYSPMNAASFNMTEAMSRSVATEAMLIKYFPNMKQAVETLFATNATDLLTLERGAVLNKTHQQTLEQAGLEHWPVEKEVSQLLLDKVMHAKLGQWFLLSQPNENNNAPQRVQLLLKLDDIQQYLFVNANGQKVLSCNIEKFAALLSSQGLEVLSEESLLSQTSDVIFKKLVASFDQAELALHSKQSLDLQQKEEALQREQRQQAAEKARVEAAKMQAEVERRNLLARQESAAVVSCDDMQVNVSPDLLRKFRMVIDGMLIGSWIEVKTGNEVKQLKLAVKFAATNRFVFVNPEGVTDSEMRREQLIELVMKKEIKIIETDQFFADRLTALLDQVALVN